MDEASNLYKGKSPLWSNLHITECIRLWQKSQQTFAGYHHPFLAVLYNEEGYQPAQIHPSPSKREQSMFDLFTIASLN
jgi:hypothetical protein